MECFNQIVALVAETVGESTTYISKIWSALTKLSQMWRAFYSGIVLQVLHQILGWNNIMCYLPIVYIKKAKFIIFFIFHLLNPCIWSHWKHLTILGLLLVDRLGRNVLIKRSFFSSLIVGILLYKITYSCEFVKYDCLNSTYLIYIYIYILHYIIHVQYENCAVDN